MNDVPKPGMIIDSQPKYDEIKQLRNEIRLMREQLMTLAAYVGHLSDIAMIK